MAGLQYTHYRYLAHRSLLHPSIHLFFFFSCCCLSYSLSLFSLRFVSYFCFFSLFSSSFQLLRPSLLRLFFLFGLAWGFRWSLLLVKSAFLEFASHPPFFPPFFASVESSSKSVYAPCAVWLLISKSTHPQTLHFKTGSPSCPLSSSASPPLLLTPLA